MRTALILAVVLLLAATNSRAGEIPAAFARKPIARRKGDKVKIEFAVSRATDVEVAVLDAEGKVVRHLAAGVLGKDAPEPFKKDSLSQEIAWDGKNDAGKPAGGAPFKLRVRLGLKARFDRVIGWSGQNLEGPRGLVCDRQGRLFVTYGARNAGHRQTTLIAAYDRDGKYLHQVFPGPAGLPPEKRKGWPRVTPEDGREIPVVFHVLTRSLYPGMVSANRVFATATGDGRLVMLSGPAGGLIGRIKYADVRGGRRLLILGTDGSVPENYLGPEVAGAKTGGFGHLALSPDDKYVYVAGLFDGKGLCNVIWRVPLDGSARASVFLGKLHAAGSGKTGLNDPQGLAIDKDGNIYVADYGNDRIAVFKPDGSFLSEIPVKFPDQVHVSRKTGAIYVQCLAERKKKFGEQHYYTPSHNWKGERIVKFGGLKDPQEKAAFKVPQRGRYGGGAFLALDDSGTSAVLWYAGVGYRRHDVLKIADQGDKLTSLGDPIHDRVKKDSALGMGSTNEIALLGGKLFSAHPFPLAFDAATGAALGKFRFKTPEGKNVNHNYIMFGDMAGGKDGRLYLHALENAAKLYRYDASGKPVPFAALGSHIIKGLEHGHGRFSGLFVTRRGDVYIGAAKKYRQVEADLRIKVIGPDGKIKNDSLLHVQHTRLGGIAVDAGGNIYVGAKAAPKGERIPDWFRGRLPADSKRHHPGNAYRQYGSILKFPPSGGEIVADPKGKSVADCYGNSVSVTVKGALWRRRAGFLPGHGHEVGCLCEATRFDIDGYGRLFVPDPFRFRVEVLDASGNQITHFGSYGNMDSRGPGSPVPEPEIAFGWPLWAVCGNDRVYVTDMTNGRFVAVSFQHAATAECTVP